MGRERVMPSLSCPVTVAVADADAVADAVAVVVVVVVVVAVAVAAAVDLLSETCMICFQMFDIVNICINAENYLKNICRIKILFYICSVLVR